MFLPLGEPFHWPVAAAEVNMFRARLCTHDPCTLSPQCICKTGTLDGGVSKRGKCVGLWNPAGSGQPALGLKGVQAFVLLEPEQAVQGTELPRLSVRQPHP